MKEMRGFDMLDNADDRTVDLLSEVPVLTKEEKERMLAMSKKKLDKMNRESNINISSDEFEVSGVERYKRPKWQIFTTTAACLLLVGGIGGTVFAMNRNGGAPSQQLAEVDETTTESWTEHDLLTTEALTDVSDDELYDIAKQLLADLETLDTLACGIPVGFDFKTTEPCAIIIDDDNDTSYKQIEGIDSLDGIRELMDSTLAEPVILEYEYKLFDGATPAFIEKDGNILFTDKHTGHRFYFEGETKVTRNDDGSGFVIETDNKSDKGREHVTFKAVNVDGKYKINNYSTSMGYADSDENLNEEADPMAIAYQAKIALNDVFKVCARIDVEVDTNDCLADESLENIFDADDENAQELFDDWKTYYVDYYRVTDSRFSSMDDVVDYVSDRVCGKFKEAMINDIKGGYCAKGKQLYCLQNGTIDDIKPFDFTSKTEIADKTDSSMTVETSFILNGEETPLYIELYILNGKWKIADYRF
jgi:hypothetical protein